MGVIQRQSFKNSIVTYIGVLIGAVSNIFIYPLIDKTDLGFAQFMGDTAKLFAPIAGFASSLTVIQFFPQFRDDSKRHNGFLFLMVASTIVSSLVFCALIYFFQHSVAQIFTKDADLFLKILPFILIATILSAQINLFQTYTSLFNRIAIPSVFTNLFQKIAQPLLILLFFWGAISLFDVLRGLGLVLILIILSLAAYLFSLGQFSLKPDFKKLTPKLSKEMLGYSSFNLIVGFGGLLAGYIDKTLVAARIGFGASAIFSLPLFIAEAIDVPRKAIASIAAPMIADFMAKENYAEVEKIYKKSALTQLVAGVYLLAGVWACADALYDLMPKNGEVYRAGKNVILILGLARLVDMATGTNAEIITYSKYFRFNFRSLFVLAVLNIGLNLLFIEWYGIIGSAWATLISITVVNIWRMVYLQKKIGIQPLSQPMLWAIVFGLIAWFVAFLTPSVSADFFGKQIGGFLTIVSKGLIITLLYGFLILYFKVSIDLDNGFDKLLSRFKR